MTVARKRVMLIGAGVFQLPAFHTAERMGIDIVALDDDPDAAGFALAAERHVVDIRDVAACVAVARDSRPDGVLCVATEAGVRSTAAVADALGLAGVSPAAAAVATDKSLMRDCIAGAGLPVPRWQRVATAAEAVSFARTVSACVVKPADSAGSRGVSYVGDVGGIEAAFDAALANSRSGTVLVEEFLEGPEISVEAFVVGGRMHVLALSDKVRTGPPALLDTTVIFPSAVAREVAGAAVESAAKAVVAAGIDSATIHMEQIVTERGPVIVEFAARGAGFRVFTDMLPWVTGVDTIEASLRLALGEDPRIDVTRQRGAVLRFPEARPGTVRAVIGEDLAGSVPGVFEARAYVKMGDVVRPLASGPDRVGHIIAFGPDRAGALEIAARAESLMRIETEPAAA